MRADVKEGASARTRKDYWKKSFVSRAKNEKKKKKKKKRRKRKKSCLIHYECQFLKTIPCQQVCISHFSSVFLTENERSEKKELLPHDSIRSDLRTSQSVLLFFFSVLDACVGDATNFSWRWRIVRRAWPAPSLDLRLGHERFSPFSPRTIRRLLGNVEIRRFSQRLFQRRSFDLNTTKTNVSFDFLLLGSTVSLRRWYDRFTCASTFYDQRMETAHREHRHSDSQQHHQSQNLQKSKNDRNAEKWNQKCRRMFFCSARDRSRWF